ncbi:uncharacterized protein PHALS_04443 [Plasmopara halstedii]|uniref:Uncharacterized protein n=1 Tax=Plasmopara halstedii TaxID=4781 RepID=A0A0P1B0C7_PLAHL|nr:uncharacterized protein PHALS_04443 [Plasmopara halstedii]CEG47575.1 hypothetical protein PHALS_04443 [Plasmopara halstedii]|eukprot:XP_024583944.1 hypothetical protein PHALS_04443 [Plasmopara halstedii]
MTQPEVLGVIRIQQLIKCTDIDTTIIWEKLAIRSTMPLSAHLLGEYVPQSA